MTAQAHATLQSGESAERGRASRGTTPRSAHGDWAPAADRPDPVAVLAAQAATRLQDLVPIRYGRMLVRGSSGCSTRYWMTELTSLTPIRLAAFGAFW